MVTTVFWRDGKTVFARTALDLSADRRSVTQFDRQGSKRFLTESVASTRLIDRQVEYGDNEVPLRERVNLGKDPKTSGIDVVHYRADGTIEARQKFRNVQSCYEACSEYFVNRHVFLMDAEGAHVQKDVEISDSLLPKTVVEFLGDGAQLIYELKLDTEKPYEAQRVYRTEFMDPNGELILIKESQTDGELFVLPKRFLEPLTFEIGLLKSWKELEQDVAANK